MAEQPGLADAGATERTTSERNSGATMAPVVR